MLQHTSSSEGSPYECHVKPTALNGEEQDHPAPPFTQTSGLASADFSALARAKNYAAINGWVPGIR